MSSNYDFNQKLFQIIQGPVTRHLQDLFKKEWNQLYPHMPWNDNAASLQHFTAEERRLKTLSPGASVNVNNLKQTGNCKQWDMTALCQVLLYSRSLNLLKRKSKLFYLVDQLRRTRNEIMHYGSAGLTKKEYQNVFSHIANCMIIMGYKEVVTEMKKIERKEKSIGTPIAFVLLAVSVFLMMSTSHSIDELNPDRFYFPHAKKPSYFTGRNADVAEISQCLVNGSFRLVNIIGMPAVGKTSTSIAVGQLLQNKYQKTVAFVGLRGANSTSDILTQITKSLTGLRIDSSERNQMILSRFASENTTLILDNIEDAILTPETSSNFLTFLRELIIDSPPSFIILCTSRKQFDIIRVPTVNIRLGPLEHSSSVEILQQL